MEEEDGEETLLGWLPRSLCSNPGGKRRLHVNYRRLRTPRPAPVCPGQAVNRGQSLYGRCRSPARNPHTHWGPHMPGWVVNPTAISVFGGCFSLPFLAHWSPQVPPGSEH